MGTSALAAAALAITTAVATTKRTATTRSLKTENSGASYTARSA